MTSRESRLLSRNYALAAIASVLPFLLVVLVLAVFQFTSQRQQLLDELEDDATEHNVLLGGILKNVRDHVASLSSWSDTYQDQIQTRPDLAPPGPNGWADLGARLITTDDGAAAGTAGVLIGHQLLPHMRIAHRAMPYVRWSWFADGDGRFMVLFPVFSDASFAVRGGRDGGRALLELIQGSGPFERVASARGPAAHWTAAYRDPAGSGWVVSQVVRVERDERVDLVGATVLLDFLTGFLRAFDYTAGKLWLINDGGQVLAASDGPVTDGLRLRTVETMLPDDLAATPGGLDPTTGLEAVGGGYAFVQPVSGTPWRLVFAVAGDEVNAVLWPRFIPYGVILAALLVTLFLAHQLRERLIIRPALSLVEYIRAESQDRPETPPDLPPVWQPSIDAVAEAFAAKRASVDQIRDDAERLRALAGAHPVPVAIVPFDDTRLVYANQAFSDLFRIALEDLPGSDVRSFHADARARAAFLQQLRKRGRIRSFEGEGRRGDGTTFPASLTSQLIRFDGQDAIVTAVIDLTEQKAAETEIARQREALHQSEKLNALGSMLASVAHELNNPLSVVVGYATMMRDLALDQRTKDRAIRIHAAAERCARIVRTFLAMARRKPESRDPLRVAELVDAALEIAGYGLRTTDIAVTVDLDPDLPPIEGDGDQLTLVIMNLIVNAQHALQTMPPPRRLEILALPADAGLVLEVRDNGPGIPAPVRSQIFEPFFTTKPQGVGTGIGLSVCHNIVTSHGGTIEVAANEGGGSVFRVFLPAGAPSGATMPLPDVMAETAARGRILVVEDEEEIAEMLKEMLERDGHRVDLAGSGRDAIACLEDSGADLIISDLHMPDLDGPELYRTLAENHPRLAERMVFMTGDVLAADVNGFLTRTGVPVLDKPIDPYELRIRVRRMLEERAKSPTAASG
jgi:PAS domain S-box-containing protein